MLVLEAPTGRKIRCPCGSDGIESACSAGSPGLVSG